MKKQIRKPTFYPIDGVFVLDRNWCYLSVNDRWCENVGLAQEVMLGYIHWDLFPDTVGTEFEQQLCRAMHEQVPVQFEYYDQSAKCWLKYSVYPSEEKIVIFAAKVSDRKRTNIWLRQENQYSDDDANALIVSSATEALDTLALSTRYLD